jgi:hypothetical protein
MFKDVDFTKVDENGHLNLEIESHNGIRFKTKKDEER